jgi:methionine-rich copper-binding protein CopC
VIPRVPLAVVLACLLVLSSAGLAAAHAELVDSDPADTDTIETPATLIAVFSIELDPNPERSFVIVRDAAGVEVARGAVSEDDLTTISAELPALPAGDYTVRWQARDPTDNHTERGTFGFTVVEAAPTPSPTPAPVTAPPATERPATPEPTEQPTLSPTPSPSPPSIDDEPTAGLADVLMALVLAGAVIGGLALYLLRRR